MSKKLGGVFLVLVTPLDEDNKQELPQVSASFFTMERPDGTTSAGITVDGFVDKDNANDFLLENHEFLKTKLVFFDLFKFSKAIH